MEWRKVTVHSEPEAEEIVSNILLELGAQGVAVNGGWQADVTPNGWDYAGELPEVPYNIDAYFGSSETERIDDLVRERLNAVIERQPLVTTEVVDDASWLNAWKRYFKPIRAADRIVIKPTWTDYAAYPDDLIVEIDPGMAFGTGGHETTRMCLKLLEQYVYGGDTVVDVGTGSGVLSIAAAKLGAETVFALEADPTAVQVAKDNAAGNAVPEQVTVIESDLLADLPAGVQADLMVSNIVADVIIRLIPNIGGSLRPNGMFLCSGIIADRLDDVVRTLQQNGMRIIAIESDGEWRAIASKNKG